MFLLRASDAREFFLWMYTVEIYGVSESPQPDRPVLWALYLNNYEGYNYET